MRLNHPNIIKVYQVLDSEDECLIVMDYASGGEMVEYAAKDNFLTEEEGRKYFRQLISAIDHFHLASVVHRDLKLENILLSQDKNLLITDFGLGRTFEESSDSEADVMSTFCGTPNYAAFELVSGIPYDGVKTDIWAMGVILFIMIAGNPPFKGVTVSQIYNM
jgi:serine/threonine protein kinase